MPEKILALNVPPGIRRDGAYIEGDLTCVDGQWVRFDRGRPRKMGGYIRITNALPNKTYGIYVDDFDDLSNIYTGHQDGIGEVVIYGDGSPSRYYDRTPSGFSSNANYLWMIDQMFDADSSQSLIIAHPGLNLNNIGNTTATAVVCGLELETGDFTTLTGATPPPEVSGGVLITHPYAWFFGSDGFVTWSAPNTPGDVTIANGGGGTAGARIAESKIVKGLSYRSGGGASPSALFWSLNSLVRATFIGGAAVFRFDTISNQTTILSTRTPIEYDGVFFWWAVDRYMRFNGFPQEVPNDKNLDWFFANLNQSYRQKVFSFKVPRRGEIWTCFPYGTATECTHAVIYNVRNNSWYDTELPNNGRTDGTAAQAYGYPFLTGAQAEAGEYKLWQHETGWDEVDGGLINAINSYFVTGNLAAPTATGRDKELQSVMFEPDFVQTGYMTIRVVGRNNARGPVVDSTQHAFDDTTEVVFLKDSRRFFQMSFSSNVVGGYYLMGTPYMHIRETGGRDTA
ncbi:MAG: hypothetical protein NTX56_04515 [Proteobacteria bacterium]|nr:hypothetical protein [Pseudomonadota bacterium]